MSNMKKIEKNEKQKETLIKVLKYMKPYRWLVVLTILMAAVSVALTLYLPVLTGNAVDWLTSLISPAEGAGSPWPALFAILKKMAVVVVLTALAQWLMGICNNKIVYSMIQDIREKAFCRIQELPEGLFGYKACHKQGNRCDHNNNYSDPHIHRKHKEQGTDDRHNTGKQLGKSNQQTICKLVYIRNNTTDNISL